MVLSLINSLKADSLKMKNTAFYWIHICVPILGILIVLIDYFRHKSNAMDSIAMLSQNISMAFPILIAVICSLVIEQEEKAGSFKELLGNVYGRYVAFSSKILLVLFWGLVSTILTISGYLIISKLFLHQDLFTVTFYIKLAFLIFGSQILLYLFHTFLSFTLGSAGSIGFALFETFIAGLMDSALGDGRWFFIPCGWCIRFSKYFIAKIITAQQAVASVIEYNLAIKCSILFTIIFFIFFIIWFRFYEGKKTI